MGVGTRTPTPLPRGPSSVHLVRQLLLSFLRPEAHELRELLLTFPYPVDGNPIEESVKILLEFFGVGVAFGVANLTKKYKNWCGKR
ncbi:hypothetical protein AKJ56_01880 [candidate division MSBL1 archaeon SCGC-AAA382N08]|uniref:Uncharacterized protein n=1 Tax=candidate division MSBL1 archaeon SCGC-AAA382N08 TaxID=1698285 RepID=A0A133VNS3_9EURY|nr:hypothetical protein AKJ56_01880 [candidate division MSBL1 archaeon SCGC-AAA382N08]